MSQIIIGFSKAKGFKPFSWAIQRVLGTPFSHSYIKFKSDKFDRVLIYQASDLKVNFIEERRMLSTHEVVAEFTVQLSDDAYKKTVQFAIDQVGVPYGISQIFGILYVKALALFGLKARNPFGNGSGNYVCSELVAQILKEIVGLEIEKDLDLIDPKEVFELLQKNHTSETL